MTHYQLGLFEHLTHKANLKHTRFGWLRLTPAYSVHLVEQILNAHRTDDLVVLDPFCGTGTTALVCAQKNIPSTTTDINPFLTWLTDTKTKPYIQEDLTGFKEASNYIQHALRNSFNHDHWTPPIHQIEKWWNKKTLAVLAFIMDCIKHLEKQYSENILSLLKITFCRVMIHHSHASFNHQSMSFNAASNPQPLQGIIEDVIMTWLATESAIYQASQTRIYSIPQILLHDARNLTSTLKKEHFTCIITSPPYPNRMSYIRELRPYMYWLGYLSSGREAGELDWQAIGGTWGIATSQVGKWEPPYEKNIPFAGFKEILLKISKQSDILSRYVHKYFYDMSTHIQELPTLLKSSGSIHYIVGNSKFYDVLLPVEEIFAALFYEAGFVDVMVKPIRKRTSKKELYEYLVEAKKP